jgi:hypothetical protein
LEFHYRGLIDQNSYIYGVIYRFFRQCQQNVRGLLNYHFERRRDAGGDPLVALPATGDLNAGKTVAPTLAFSGAVTVAGGTPTLTLNDGTLPTPTARVPTPSPSTTPWLPDGTLPPSQQRPSTCQAA